MGLGKTVEALAAAELRRAVPWAIGYGAAPRAVAVVAPNAGVLDQWVAPCVEINQCDGCTTTRQFSTNAP